MTNENHGDWKTGRGLNQKEYWESLRKSFNPEFIKGDRAKYQKNTDNDGEQVNHE